MELHPIVDIIMIIFLLKLSEIAPENKRQKPSGIQYAGPTRIPYDSSDHPLIAILIWKKLPS